MRASTGPLDSIHMFIHLDALEAEVYETTEDQWPFQEWCYVQASGENTEGLIW